jgi:hypothetical protein
MQQQPMQQPPMQQMQQQQLQQQPHQATMPPSCPPAPQHFHQLIPQQQPTPQPPMQQPPPYTQPPARPAAPAGYSQPGGGYSQSAGAYSQPGGYSQPGCFSQPGGFLQPGAGGFAMRQPSQPAYGGSPAQQPYVAPPPVVAPGDPKTLAFGTDQGRWLKVNRDSKNPYRSSFR